MNKLLADLELNMIEKAIYIIEKWHKTTKY